MRSSLLRRLSTAALFAAALVCFPARAQQSGFATANLQVLQAWNMHDPILGNDPVNGKQTVVTFNYFSDWKFGDVNMFVDFNRANTHMSYGSSTITYGEVQPRILLGKTFGAKGPLLGIFSDLGPAFELNQGSNYWGYLGGIGGNFALPRPYILGLNLYYKADQFQGDIWQATTFWGFPFKIAGVPFAFTGFADWSGLTSYQAHDGSFQKKAALNFRKTDLITQPELLVDVGHFFGQPGQYWVGTEWYVHANPSKDSQAVQAMFQYTIR